MKILRWDICITCQYFPDRCDDSEEGECEVEELLLQEEPAMEEVSA